MNQIIKTERLRVREFNEGDSEFILKLLNSPGWLQFIGDRNIKTLEDARHYIVNGPLFSYHKFGFGPYLVELHDTKKPIGMSSLIKRDALEDVDIGFAFLSEHTGKGYAYEASEALLRYAKNNLGLKKLVAITNLTNTSSIKLLQKIGFVSQSTIKMPDDDEELLFFTYIIH